MKSSPKKKGLGRGLSALINESDINSIKDKNAEKLVGSIVEIDIDAIEANPFQPRSHFNASALNELASSIKTLGVIQPVTVRKLEGNRFQLVSGERRFRASKMIGMPTIPAYIRLANDQEMLEMALVENIQRKDLDPIEVALTFQRLIEEINLTQEEMSERVGKKRSTVTNYLRLLKLDPIVQTGMRDGMISMGHGRALVNVEEKKAQLTIYENIIEEKLSVRQTEELIRQLKEQPKAVKKAKTPAKQTMPSFINEGIQKFANFFGGDVEVKVSGKNKGKLLIPFNSEEDFNRLKKLLE